MGQPATTDRLDVWQDIIRENFVALDIVADRRASFRGRVRSTELGHLHVASVRSGPQSCTRTPQLARADDAEYLQVGLLTRGAAVVQQDDREAVLTPGDFAVYETDRAFCWRLQQDWELLVLTWPRDCVPLGGPASRALTARRLRGGDGLGAIVGRMLRDLVVSPPALSVEGEVRLGAEVLDLVTTVAQEEVRPSAPPRSADDLLRRIDDHILQRLGDPDLTPTGIAAAHFISTRHLHRLFALRQSTVSRHVQHLRLERARLELRHPTCRDRSITDIAWRWGFADLATFSRAFRAAYGTTPSRYRTADRHPAAAPSRSR
ncbi:Transcriptional regulator, AraC family [Modestobacter italicus]|uniref:Transcriptional regulator, AraC family n=1 Tax=Modestobacter italicus (strain DSM 44449 / CECT 9708 / BC 501) TaxID=2732864 RepID=I4EVA5_MODI5|nr:helix-turn-helix domain-containing protein [Modestobacter marinus]CCH87318.1 Transcriptional regulator, AraC family [Modestobacter marinus]